MHDPRNAGPRVSVRSAVTRRRPGTPLPCRPGFSGGLSVHSGADTRNDDGPRRRPPHRHIRDRLRNSCGKASVIQCIPAADLREDRLRGNDVSRVLAVIPAKAGIHTAFTEHECASVRAEAAADSRVAGIGAGRRRRAMMSSSHLHTMRLAACTGVLSHGHLSCQRPIRVAPAFTIRRKNHESPP